MNDAVTCGTCRTLNPPGLPACVRCNTPLGVPGPSATAGAGLLAASSAAAGAVAGGAAGQSAGESVTGPAGREAEPGGAARGRREVGDDRLYALPPAVQRRVLRRIEIIGAVVVLVVLLAGGAVIWSHRPRTIDTAAVARTIEGELSGQLGQPVRLTCPDRAARSRGTTFTCIATDATGAQRGVVVTVTGDDGTYRWQLR